MRELARAAASLVLLTFPLGAAGATLLPGSEAQDTRPVNSVFPPGFEPHPFDPNRAFVARATNIPSVVQVAIAPGMPLLFTGVPFILPDDDELRCFESGPFATPIIGSLALDPAGGSLARAWVTTSSCELAVPFDVGSGEPWPIDFAGQTRIGVPTRRQVQGVFTTYRAGGAGAEVTSFLTNFTSHVLRAGGRLLVSTSNFRRTGSDPELYPGTVLLFDIDDSVSPTRVVPSLPPYVVTSDPNPTSLAALPGGLVAVTNTGLLDPGFPPILIGKGSLDILDPVAGALVGSIPLGAGNPAGPLAVDPSGSVAVATSHTLRSLYAVDVRGLEDLSPAALDPTLQRPSCNDVVGEQAGGLPCLRERVIRGAASPIALPPPPGASGGLGFLPAVRFGASGNFVAATSLNDGGLGLVAFDPRNLGRPHPLLPSRFGSPETEAAAPPAGQYGDECCPAGLLLHANSAGGVNGAHVLWVTGEPDGVVVRGFLAGSLAAPYGDADGDGVEDALDTCPLEADPSQRDVGGVGAGAPPDGIGDVCQCGDVSGDGRVLDADVGWVRDRLAERVAGLPAPELCNVSGAAGPGDCDVRDAVALRRALAGLPPGLSNTCAPFLP